MTMNKPVIKSELYEIVAEMQDSIEEFKTTVRSMLVNDRTHRNHILATSRIEDYQRADSKCKQLLFFLEMALIKDDQVEVVRIMTLILEIKKFIAEDAEQFLRSFQL